MSETFRRNTIVVGAGASKEFGLPTGKELAGQIAEIADIRFNELGRELVSGDYKLVETLRLLAKERQHDRGEINPYLYGAWKIRDNMPLTPSIDNFLDTHRANPVLVEFGKIAICHAIQKAESLSVLYCDQETGNQKLKFDKLENTWLNRFFKILVAQRTFADFIGALENITFVSFNYDRCIHQFFYHATISYFDLEDKDLQTLGDALDVYYPYGNIGDFEWVGNGRSNFGQVNYGNSLIKTATKLRTFTEGSATNVKSLIDKSILESEVVMFLGFGFLGLNMDLMFKDRRYPAIRVLGTTKGLSKDSVGQVEMELADVFKYEAGVALHRDKPDRISIQDCTCAELFHIFERYLSR